VASHAHLKKSFPTRAGGKRELPGGLDPRLLVRERACLSLLRRPQGHTTRAHLWAAIGEEDFPYVVFDFTSAYTADGPKRCFGSYAGYLQADALAQYEQLYGEQKVGHVSCWAHARRRFVAAHEADDERAAGALELIGKLYAVESALPPLLAPSDDPATAEQQRAREEQPYAPGESRCSV
jgi:hypothetical protein